MTWPSPVEDRGKDRDPLQATDEALNRRLYPFKLRALGTVGSNEDVVISPFLLYFWSPVTLTHCFLRGGKCLLLKCDVFRAWYQLKAGFQEWGETEQLFAISLE